jgi:hypothetical protein
MTRTDRKQLYLTNFQKCVERRLNAAVDRPSDVAVKTLKGHSQPTLRPDCLSNDVAITSQTHQSDWISETDSTDLVEEDCLPKFFNELHSYSGISVFIEDPCALPFFQ